MKNVLIVVLLAVVLGQWWLIQKSQRQVREAMELHYEMNRMFWELKGEPERTMRRPAWMSDVSR